MERLNIVKTEILPKSVNRSNVIPVKIPANVFVQIHKLILKCIWKFNHQNSFEKEKESWGSKLTIKLESSRHYGIGIRRGLIKAIDFQYKCQSN